MMNPRSVRRIARWTLAIISMCEMPPVAIAQQRLSGFSAEAARAQKQVEEKFKRIPSPDEARKQHRYFTAEPHPAGSARNNELALSIAETWKQQGLEDVQVHRYDVFSSYPREVSAEMIAPIAYRASLREDAYEVDPDTRLRAQRKP
jgi:N-acetylated-alpha-linked acidic dipeptidase